MDIQNEIKTLLNRELTAVSVQVVDVVGDESYFLIHVKSSDFNHKTRLEQHQIVNEILRDTLKSRIVELQTEEVL